MANAPQNPHEMFKKFPVDPHHEVQETFVDQIVLVTFDNAGMHMELAAARMDEPKPPAMPTGKRHIVCRLVVSQACVVDLINQMQQIATQLAQMGLIKMDRPPTPVQPIGPVAGNA